MVWRAGGVWSDGRLVMTKAGLGLVEEGIEAPSIIPGLNKIPACLTLPRREKTAVIELREQLNQPFVAPCSVGPASRDARHRGLYLRLPVLIGTGPVDQALLIGLLCGPRTTLEEEFQGIDTAHHAHDTCRLVGCQGKAEPSNWNAKARSITRDAQVADCGNLKATPNAGAVDGCHHRNRAVQDGPKGRTNHPIVVVGSLLSGLALRGELGDVGPGSKGISLTTHHHHPEVRLSCHSLKTGGDVLPHAHRECIETARVGEPDRGDRVRMARA